MQRRILMILLAVMLCAGSVGVASAFPFTRSWHESTAGVAGTNRAGGNGIYGTGGRTDHGVKCTDCHVEGAGMVDFNIGAMPMFPLVGGERSYHPGQRYTITVTLTGEHLRAGLTMNNLNGMAATIEDRGGVVRGRFIADAGQDSNSCPSANPYPMNTWPAMATTFMYGDCHGVLPIPRMGLTSWKFDWVAPAAGTGDLTIFVGVVDGNSGGDSSLGDDSIERSIPLVEGS